MVNRHSARSFIIPVVRWITRIYSLLAVLFVMFMEGSEMLGSQGQGQFSLTANMAGMISGTLCMLGGLLAAWKWEIGGGLTSLAGFVLIGILNHRVWDAMLLYPLFVLPALLYIICGLTEKFLLLPVKNY